MRSVHHTINRSGVRVCASPRSSVSGGVKRGIVQVLPEHYARTIGGATLDLVCDASRLSFSCFCRKSPLPKAGVLRWLGNRLALFRRCAATTFLTCRPSRSNCHCASWCWTLGLLSAGVLRRFCSQQSDLVSSPFGESLVVLPVLEDVDGWGAMCC